MTNCMSEAEYDAGHMLAKEDGKTIAKQAFFTVPLAAAGDPSGTGTPS